MHRHHRSSSLGSLGAEKRSESTSSWGQGHFPGSEICGIHVPELVVCPKLPFPVAAFAHNVPSIFSPIPLPLLLKCVFKSLAKFYAFAFIPHLPKTVYVPGLEQPRVNKLWSPGLQSSLGNSGDRRKKEQRIPLQWGFFKVLVHKVHCGLC